VRLPNAGLAAFLVGAFFAFAVLFFAGALALAFFLLAAAFFLVVFLVVVFLFFAEPLPEPWLFVDLAAGSFFLSFFPSSDRMNR
jgi:hypothetical protein